MSQPPKCDRAALSAAVLSLLTARGRFHMSDRLQSTVAIHKGTLRLSSAFLALWCGSTGPTGELNEWAHEHGLEFAPGNDFAGGWELRQVSEEQKVGQMEIPL